MSENDLGKIEARVMAHMVEGATLTADQITMAVQKMLVIEQACLNLRKELCDGNMIHGWTLKQFKDIDQARVVGFFSVMQDDSDEAGNIVDGTPAGRKA